MSLDWCLGIITTEGNFYFSSNNGDKQGVQYLRIALAFVPVGWMSQRYDIPTVALTLLIEEMRKLNMKLSYGNAAHYKRRNKTPKTATET